MLFASTCPAGAGAANPATTQPTTITQGAGEPATNAPAATAPATTAPAATAPATTAPAATAPATTAPATTAPAMTAPATTQPALTASSIPAADSFRAFDRPSDDGSGILVVWARPAEEPENVTYVIEVARSKEDFRTGRFKTKEVSPSPKILASTKPVYFGYSEQNKGLYYTVITPADLFEPAQPGPLTERRLKDFADQHVITAGQLKRALAVMAALKKESPATGPATVPGPAPATGSAPAAAPTTAPATKPAPAAAKPPKLTPAEQAEREWYARLAAYLATRDADAVEAETAKINAAPHFFRLAVKLGGQTALVARDGEPAVVQASARADWFKWGKLNNLVLALIFSAIVVTFIEIAKRRPGLFIRKIGGLEAIDEAIGRSTEMDRPVYFVHGSGGVSDLSAIASVNILSHIAYRTAEHDSRIHVMNQDPIVTAVSQEVVQQACTRAGRPDAYNPDDVSLVAYEQFAFVAAVSGMMVRRQPGAIFILGYFGAESLLLAETGSSTGAIQVAGTDAYTQLPFFITTCDYTLMGEELYAASAYLSREPRLLGSLRGQDVGKAFIMAALLIGTIVLTLAAAKGWDVAWLRGLLKAGN
jgi:hypothetical protein